MVTRSLSLQATTTKGHTEKMQALTKRYLRIWCSRKINSAAGTKILPGENPCSITKTTLPPVSACSGNGVTPSALPERADWLWALSRGPAAATQDSCAQDWLCPRAGLHRFGSDGREMLESGGSLITPKSTGGNYRNISYYASS